MKTLILSSSLSPNSNSFLLCKKVEEELIKKNVVCTFIDVRQITVNPYHSSNNQNINIISDSIKNNDNIIIGMGVHNYSISDNLKIILDNCFSEANGKFYGILCTAGGEKSYLATMHLTQICINQWKMIQLPQTVYATSKDFSDSKIKSEDIIDIIKNFCNQYYTVGKKLLS